MGRVVARSAKLGVPQKYHLDISNIQHHPKVGLSAIKVRLLTPKYYAISRRYTRNT